MFRPALKKNFSHVIDLECIHFFFSWRTLMVQTLVTHLTWWRKTTCGSRGKFFFFLGGVSSSLHSDSPTASDIVRSRSTAASWQPAVKALKGCMARWEARSRRITVWSRMGGERGRDGAQGHVIHRRILISLFCYFSRLPADFRR